MPSHAETVPAASDSPPANISSQRLFSIGFLSAVAIAMIGWVAALVWAAIQVGNWLL